MNRTAIYACTACSNETALNRQVQVLQGLAAELNLNVTYIIRETAGGLDFDRQGLQKLMRLAKQREIDTVLMTNLDRIGRYAMKVLDVLEELNSHGVKLLIQGGDTAEVDDNPLLKCLRRFTLRPSLEVVLA